MNRAATRIDVYGLAQKLAPTPVILPEEHIDADGVCAKLIRKERFRNPSLRFIDCFVSDTATLSQSDKEFLINKANDAPQSCPITGILRTPEGAVLARNGLAPVEAQRSSLPFHFQGFLDTWSGYSLFVDYRAQYTQQHCLVFVNPFTKNSTYWQPIREYFEERGFATLAYDLRHQHRSLLYNRHRLLEPHASHKDHAHELLQLMAHLEIVQPTLIGLSFGTCVALTALAEAPDTIKSVIAMAPVVAPPSRQHRRVSQQLAKAGISNPSGPEYRRGLCEYAQQRLYPILEYPPAEPAGLRKRVASKITLGIQDFVDDQTLLRHLPPHKVDLYLPEEDEYLRLNWSRIESFFPATALREVVVFRGCKHVISDHDLQGVILQIEDSLRRSSASDDLIFVQRKIPA